MQKYPGAQLRSKFVCDEPSFGFFSILQIVISDESVSRRVRSDRLIQPHSFGSFRHGLEADMPVSIRFVKTSFLPQWYEAKALLPQWIPRSIPLSYVATG